MPTEEADGGILFAILLSEGPGPVEAERLLLGVRLIESVDRDDAAGDRDDIDQVAGYGELRSRLGSLGRVEPRGAHAAQVAWLVRTMRTLLVSVVTVLSLAE